MLYSFKNNSLASFLMGIIIGAGVVCCGQKLLPAERSNGHIQGIATIPEDTQPKKKNNFDKIPYSVNGDAYVTRTGKAFHPSGCSHLSKSPKIQRVNSSEAKAAGLHPCSMFK